MPEEDERAAASRLLKFRMHVAKDTLAVLLVIQLVIVAFAFLVRACDTKSALRNSFPDFISAHEKTTYYLCGVLIFFILLGLAGAIGWCCGAFEDLQGVNLIRSCCLGSDVHVCICPNVDCGDCHCQ